MLPDSFEVELHEVLDSTQDAMRQELQSGRDVHGLVLRARSQRRGRGRLGRDWASETGGSYQTIALRDPDGSYRSGLVTVAIALGVAERFETAGFVARVKWPNDLYADGGKLGGILCEHLRGHLLVGVGINVDNPVPAGASALTGSDPDAVSDLVLHGIRHGLDEVLSDPRLPARYRRFDLLAGRRLRMSEPPRELEGRGAGISAAGCLLLETVDGATVETCNGRIVEFAGEDLGF